MAIKYIPQNRSEIQIYRRNRAIKERSREDITRNTLVELRKVNLVQRKRNESFAELAGAFTMLVKKQKNKNVMEVFNYFLSEID